MARLAPLATAFIACSALAIVPFARSNVFIWNASPSVPVGLYLIERWRPDIGAIAVLRPPDWASILANQRGYLPKSAMLLKPVVAYEGDLVCRFGRFVFVNGHLRAVALQHDKMNRPLPSWKGCLSLGNTQIFVLSRHRDSFDSRYFGPIDEGNVIGTGRLIFFPSK